MAEGNFDGRTSFPAGARCAHHPEREAERTCVRCGNYMCRECISASSDGICLFCASRLGAGAGPSAAFPYSRDHYTFDGLLNLALSRWKQNWLRLSAVQAVVFLFAFTPAIAIGAITFVSHRAD
ncbi:MAG TPA: hypothetical protein VHZ95_01030, partial [Polyangiales bacterium]|nr:hypothetical protein [Polyangiales bacterium]